MVVIAEKTPSSLIKLSFFVLLIQFTSCRQNVCYAMMLINSLNDVDGSGHLQNRKFKIMSLNDFKQCLLMQARLSLLEWFEL